MAVELKKTKDCENWHVMVFSFVQDQRHAQNKLRDLGVVFDEFPMGRTVAGDITEEQFNEFIAPYQGVEDSGLIDLAFFENKSQVEKIADWNHDYGSDPGDEVAL